MQQHDAAPQDELPLHDLSPRSRSADELATYGFATSSSIQFEELVGLDTLTASQLYTCDRKTSRELPVPPPERASWPHRKLAPPKLDAFAAFAELKSGERAEGLPITLHGTAVARRSIRTREGPIDFLQVALSGTGQRVNVVLEEGNVSADGLEGCTVVARGVVGRPNGRGKVPLVLYSADVAAEITSGPGDQRFCVAPADRGWAPSLAKIGIGMHCIAWRGSLPLPQAPVAGCWLLPATEVRRSHNDPRNQNEIAYVLVVPL